MRRGWRWAPLVAAALALSAALGCQAAAGSAPRAAAPPDASAGGPAAPLPAAITPAAAGPAAPAAADPAAPAPLAPAVPGIVADNLTAAGVGLYVAIERGYFADEGLDVSLERMTNPSDIFTQLAAGRFDAAGSSTGPVLFNAVQRGIGLKVVADQSSITPRFTATSGIVVARTAADDGRFPTVASLRGRQIAVASQGSSAEFGMLRVLGQAGLGRDDVQLTVLNFPDVNGALVNGALDAAWQAEPFVTLGVRQGQIHRLIGSEDPTGVVHSASVIVYGEEFVARKPEAAERFMVGYLRGVRDSYEAFFGGGQ